MTDDKSTEASLVESFRALMMEIPFKKITIKKITDGAGVIRPTFYNYFTDKYMIFEKILDDELFSTLHTLVEIGMLEEIIPVIFKYFDTHKAFYKKAFSIDDTYNFCDILSHKIESFLIHLLHEFPVYDEVAIDNLGKEIVSKYYTLGLIQMLKRYCNSTNTAHDVNFYIGAYTYLASHTLSDIFVDVGNRYID